MMHQCALCETIAPTTQCCSCDLEFCDDCGDDELSICTDCITEDEAERELDDELAAEGELGE